MNSTTLESHDLVSRRALAPAQQWRWLAVGAGALVLLAAAVWLLGHAIRHADVPPSAAPVPAGAFRPTDGQRRTLTIEPVQTARFVSMEVTDGRIALDGDRSTPVYSPYSGRVVAIHVAPGERVARGAPLATVEATEYVQAVNALRTARAQAELARVAEERAHALYDAKGGALQDWQKARADLAAAEAGYTAARNQLRIFGRDDGSIDALAAGTRSVAPETTLAAPIAGVVVDRQVGPGQFVQAGASAPLFTVADVSRLWLVANVRETDAPRVHVGQAVEVQVPAWPGRTFAARVSYVSPSVDPATHRLPVRAVIDNADGALKPEMLATFRIATDGGGVAPAVPAAAVVHDGEAAHVWVAKGDLLVLRPVRLGRELDGRVEVLDGLAAGDRIVTRGSLFVDAAAGGG